MKMYQLVIMAWVCAWSVSVQEQWQWLDKDGRKVFSDVAPPPDTPQKNILQQPGRQRTQALMAGTAAPVALPSAAAAAPAPAASPPAPLANDKELQQRKAQLNAQETEHKKAEAAKNAALRADNCSRAQRAKTTFDSGKPVRQTNAQGELVWLDEAARATEVRRLQSIITSDCSPHS